MSGGGAVIDLGQELDPFLMAMSRQAGPDHQSFEHYQGGENRVVVPLRL